jgi:hypothetical protein
LTKSRIFAIAAVAAVLAGCPATAQQGEHRLTVINGADVAIEYFFFANCGAGAWGKDRLGTREIIEPGARKLFSIKVDSGDCCHDLRAKLQTGASRQKLNADVCRDPEWVVH